MGITSLLFKLRSEERTISKGFDFPLLWKVLVFFFSLVGHGKTTNSGEMLPSGGRNVELGCIGGFITTVNSQSLTF